MLKALIPLLHPPTDPKSNSPDQGQIVDLFKGLTPFVILLLILTHQQAPYYSFDNKDIWIYLGIHGSYGILWVAKKWFDFQDEKFVGSKGWFMTLTTIIGLIFYWVPAWIIVQRGPSQQVPNWALTLAIVSYAFGVFMHFSSDLQKKEFLEWRAILQKVSPKDAPLILKSKLWKRTRNPNYLGELFIYCSFCILGWHWFPWFWLSQMVGIYWMTSMMLKDERLSRHKDFPAYKQQSSFFIPGLW